MSRRSYDYIERDWDYVANFANRNFSDKLGYGSPTWGNSWTPKLASIDGTPGVVMDTDSCGYMIPIPIGKTLTECREFTLEIDFVKTALKNPGYPNLFDCEHAGSNGYNFQRVSGAWDFYLGKGIADANVGRITDSALPKNTWLTYSLTVSQRTKTARFMLTGLSDGVIVYSHEAPILPSYTEGSYPGFLVGRCAWFTSRYLDGLVSEVRYRNN